MTDLRTAAQQALEAMEYNRLDVGKFNRINAACQALRAALAQQAEPVGPVACCDLEERKALSSVKLPCDVRIGHGTHRKGSSLLALVVRSRSLYQMAKSDDYYGYASRLAVALWEKHYKDTAPHWKPLDDLVGVLTQIDNMTSGLTRRAQQAEPVVRGAAYADALRWTIKACGAVQQHDGVWFGDDAAARLARVLSEGIIPPQQAEPVVGVVWSVDWGRDGDRACASIVKKRADGSAEIVAVEYAPYTAPPQQAEPVDTDCHTQGICQRSGYGIGQQAEPVEPVAWSHNLIDNIITHRPADIDRRPDRWTPLCKCADIPLQRKPLTEEEIRLLARDTFLEAENIWNEDTHEDLTEFARAVERAHGIPKP